MTIEYLTALKAKVPKHNFLEICEFQLLMISNGSDHLTAEEVHSLMEA